MAKDWGIIADEIPNYIRDLFNEGPSSVKDFVRDGTPQSLTGQAGQASYRAACRRWARGEGRQSERADNLYGEICEPYLKDIGEWPGDEGTTDGTVGGQCPGVIYNCTAIRIRNNGNGPPADDPCEYFDDGRLTVASGLIGPIRGLFSTTENAAPGVDTRRYFIRHGDGLEANLGGFFTGCPNAGFFSLQCTRADGLPDTCGDGNPQPVTRPELPSPAPPDRNPPGTPPGIDIPIDITINPDGTIDIDIDGNPTTIDPDSDAGGGGGGNPKPTVGEGEDGEEDGGDNDFGDPPEGEEWIGAFVELTTVPEEYGSIPGTAPQTVYPAPMGNASLYGNGKRYTAERLLSRWSGHFVEVARLPVEGIRVNVRPGIGYKFYPVSIPIDGGEEEDG
jgi:hypothetical protein